jgi:2-methylcitrate dehydratase PrpD
MRIINKTGPLHNHADRDHCLQYAVAIGLLFGHLEREHYSDEVAADPRIDALRTLMRVEEHKPYSIDYLDPDKRAIGNGVAIHFKNGDVIKSAIDYPIGHKRRRAEAQSLLKEKFKFNLEPHYKTQQLDSLLALMDNLDWLMDMPVSKFMKLWQPENDDSEQHEEGC